MSTSRSLLLALAVCVAGVLLATALPNRRQRREIGRRHFTNVRPQGKQLLIDAQVGNLLRTAPTGASLIATKPTIPAIMARLPDNSSLIRPNIVDTFRCDERSYGYYADQDNECQIFHVCLPLKQIYPANFTSDITYQFSFICPKHTIFSQDAMVCAWETEAIPCEYASELYWMNQNFFREVEDTFGTRYAHVNEPLSPQTP